MTAELTVLSAFVARMPDPAVQLAAWGVVFALSTLIQAPSTSLLPTGTALARDVPSFRSLARYAGGILLVLTLVHLLVAATPLYGVVVRGAMGVPEEVAQQGRLALLTMLPWSFGTGVRRFLQGVMIRHGRPRVVIIGSMLRLAVGAAVMAVGSAASWLPGARLAAFAIIVAVLTEMAYNVLMFFGFYAPLVLVTVLTMFVQTLVTVVLGRMPRPLESLAVWPVLNSFLVMLQGPGLAYTEVSISLLDRPGARAMLGRVAFVASAALTGLLAVLALTPLSRLWFGSVSGLTGEYLDLAVAGLWLALLVPGLRLVGSWYQGLIIHARRTLAILESVVVFLVVGALVLGAGVVWGGTAGLYVGVVGLTFSLAAQAGWLGRRAELLRQEGLGVGTTLGGTA
jgi:hypothetical protein